METTIKDSGQRSEFDTGAHRDCQDGKGRMDLLPFWALIEVSKVYEGGAKKYRANNWRRGIPLSRYVDSGTRHFAKWMAGWRDEPHLAQAVWNYLCLMETQELIRQGLLPESLNDLPYNELDVEYNPLGIPDLNLSDEGAELDEVGKQAEDVVTHDYYVTPVDPEPDDYYIDIAIEQLPDEAWRNLVKKLKEEVLQAKRDNFRKTFEAEKEEEPKGPIVTDADIARCSECIGDGKDDRRGSITAEDELEALDSLTAQQRSRLYSEYTLEQLRQFMVIARVNGVALDVMIDGVEQATRDSQRVEEIAKLTCELARESQECTERVLAWMEDYEAYSEDEEDVEELEG